MKKYHRRKYRVVLQLKRAVRAIVYLFNLHTLLLLAASCFAVCLCARNGWAFDMEFTIISTGTIFPLTFALAQAYTRREHATYLIADLKASVVGLYWMHRDWDQTNSYPACIGNDFLPNAVHAKAVLVQLLLSLRRYLMSTSSFESMAEVRLQAHKHEFLAIFDHNLKLFQKTQDFRQNVDELLEHDEGQRHLADVYKWLSQVSVMNEKLTFAAGYSKGGEGGFSRTAQYLRYLISSIENLRVIREYRTPSMMRHASGVLLHVFGIILAPYFVHFCSEEAINGCAAAYFSSCSYVMIVMLLYHVQQDLENCFSVSGLDDALFLVAEEVDALTGATVLQCTASDRTCVQGASPIGDSPKGATRASLGSFSHVFNGSLHSFNAPSTDLNHDKPSLKPILEGIRKSDEQSQEQVSLSHPHGAVTEGFEGPADRFAGGGAPALAAIFTRSTSRRMTETPSSSWYTGGSGSGRTCTTFDCAPTRAGSLSGTHQISTAAPYGSSSPTAASTVTVVCDDAVTDMPEERSQRRFGLFGAMRQVQISLPPTALGCHTEDSPFAQRSRSEAGLSHV